MGELLASVQKTIRHPLPLGAVLVGSGIAFTAAPGSLGDFMAVAGALFAVNVLFGAYRLRNLTAGHVAALGVVAVMVLISMSLPGARVHERSLRYLLLTPGMIMACHALSKQIEDVRRETLTAIAAAMVCVCVTVQLIGFQLHPPGVFYGFYSNPHHLGLFASLALPLMAYVLLRLNGWRRAAIAPWVVAALYLLWQSGSRISWLVFFASIPPTALLFLGRKQSVGLIFGTGGLAAVSAWLSGFSAIATRMNDLWVNLWSEERTLIWPATWEVLKRNSPGEWLLGHGIGSFRFDFKEAFPDVEHLNVAAFPHNAVLQLLFENGLIGLLLVLTGFGALMWTLWRTSRRGRSDPGARHLAMTLFALLFILAGHCLLTKSIYSRYILYSLSLVIGASLVLIEKTREGPDGAA
jgi:O-antigen ligase